MKVTHIVAVTVAAFGLGCSGVASADAAVGKAKFSATCAECHEVGDFEGETAAGLAATLKQMVAGQKKHKGGMKLTEAEIAGLAEYIAAGK